VDPPEPVEIRPDAGDALREVVAVLREQVRVDLPGRDERLHIGPVGDRQQRVPIRQQVLVRRRDRQRLVAVSRRERRDAIVR